jgi:hypothetical protein
MAHPKLWKTRHKPEETPINDGDYGYGKGKDTAKKDLEPPPENDF